MNKAMTMHDRETLAFLAMLPDDGDSRVSAAEGMLSRRCQHSFQRRMWGALSLYALTVTGASGVLFLIGVLARRW